MKKYNGINEEFESVKDLICHILEKNPEARSNDTILYSLCCRELGAVTIEDIIKLDLNMISVHKLRQVIQNREGKYLPSDRVLRNRKIKEEQVREYMSNQKIS